MRILLVNKYHYLKGGSEKYYFELGKLLKEHGHEVAYFSMRDEKNIKTGCKEYFVEPVDLNNGSKLKALDVIYSKENKKKMEEALEDFKPDIVHLNNFQRQLSASIIEPMKKENIPIIFTAHDVQAICPAILMLDNKKNVCEKCLKGRYTNCIKNKCNKDSILKSIVGAVEGYYYRKNKIYTKKIDYIITPSEFYKNKLIEDGMNRNKILAIHNFIDIDEYNVPKIDEGYALYVGRLSKEKGIFNLIKAFSLIEKGELRIAGDGPEKENIIQFIVEQHLEGRVKLLGYLDKYKIKEQIRKSRFVVVPSIWYENCPYSIMETLAIGKPVIGANIGGIPELIQNHYSGFTYVFDNIEELASCMRKLLDNVELASKLGNNAKEQAKKLYSKEVYYEKILKIYTELIKGE